MAVITDDPAQAENLKPRLSGFALEMSRRDANSLSKAAKLWQLFGAGQH